MATSRGSNLRGFVKEGRSSATIILTIRNRGQDAFRHEVYGDKIVVERRINADGGGTWKTKSALGNIVSSKREELNAICDHCHIQVDNPLNVLSQDASRQFLGSSDSREKYSFFLRGTQLSQLSQEHDIIRSNIDRMSKVVYRKREILPELEARARDCATRYEMLDKATQQYSKLRSLKGLLVWAQVSDEEEVSPGRAVAHRSTPSYILVCSLNSCWVAQPKRSRNVD